MKKNFKRLVTGMITAAMAATVLAGCGSSSNSGSSSAAGSSAAGESSTTAGSSAPISGQTLEVMLSAEPTAEDALGNALTEWSKESGNEIKQIILNNDDMLTKFPSMAKNHDMPDLIATTALHQLYPEEFVDMSTVLDLSKFNDSPLQIVGKSYSSDEITGIPDQFTTTCVYYNKDAFTKAGLTAPTADDPWTWDELWENAKTLQDKGGVKYGFAADVSRARYDIMMYANGGSMVEKDGDTFKVAVNSPQNIQTLETFVNENNEVMPKAIWAGGTTDNPADYFSNGDVGIYLSGSWQYNTFASNISAFDWGVMPSPKGTSSQAAIIGGEALAIPNDAKNGELAKQFLQWLFTDEHYPEYLQRRKEPSVMKDFTYKPEDEKGAADFQQIQNETTYVTDSFMTDESSSWRTYKDNEYRDYMKQAVAGEISAADALNNFAKELSESSNWEMAYNN